MSVRERAAGRIKGICHCELAHMRTHYRVGECNFITNNKDHGCCKLSDDYNVWEHHFITVFRPLQIILIRCDTIKYRIQLILDSGQTFLPNKENRNFTSLQTE